MEHGALDLNNVVFSYFDLNLECLDQPELRIYIDVEFWRENNTGLLNKVKIFIICIICFSTLTQRRQGPNSELQFAIAIFNLILLFSSAFVPDFGPCPQFCRFRVKGI